MRAQLMFVVMLPRSWDGRACARSFRMAPFTLPDHSRNRLYSPDDDEHQEDDRRSNLDGINFTPKDDDNNIKKPVGGTAVFSSTHNF